MLPFLIASTVTFVLLAGSPCFAASAETEAFIANIRLNAAFLAASSSLAADHSDNSDLRAFAAREVPGEEAVTNALDKRAVPEVAQTVPMTVASNDVMTGRSAAVDPETATDRYAAPAGTGALMPAASITLDHLGDTKGEAFDSLYKATQINTLRQLAALYNAYALTGDDAALRQMAREELAATDARIADLGRL